MPFLKRDSSNQARETSIFLSQNSQASFVLLLDLLRNRLEGHQIDDCSDKIDSYSESISTVSVFG